MSSNPLHRETSKNAATSNRPAMPLPAFHLQASPAAVATVPAVATDPAAARVALVAAATVLVGPEILARSRADKRDKAVHWVDRRAPSQRLRQLKAHSAFAAAAHTHEQKNIATHH